MRVPLGLEYDGSGFLSRGWQIQRGARNVQACVELVTDVGYIQRILAYLGSPPRLRASPRPPAVLPFEEDFEPRKGTDLSKPLPEFEFDQRVSW